MGDEHDDNDGGDDNVPADVDGNDGADSDDLDSDCRSEC